MFTQVQPLYMLLYASVIIFFCFFYTSIVFNPTETAENLRKYGGYIPGIRPGERSAEYIETILNRLTTIGALYLTFVCFAIFRDVFVNVYVKNGIFKSCFRQSAEGKMTALNVR